MMQTCQNFSFAVNFPEACDMILEVAVIENLQAEQMMKKVFVFTDFASGCHWKTKYEEVRTKFKEQGYEDDAIPQVLIWGLFDLNMPSIEEPHPGLTVLSGFSDNLSKLFLDNGEEIGPHQLMEAAIADKEYQALRVVEQPSLTKSIKLSMWWTETSYFEVGLYRARRLAQGQSIKIHLFAALPVQIDGEPWFQQPCTLAISHNRQALHVEEGC
ncbi:diacylglycerol kinase gamma-like [Prunus avium]|uniref:Diacylglycerol kinase gamma-like n=1 Tax=Prunus avium TaxID=42229 RepID=A0A6P5T2E1_PRUAV|nr:diacylglycerol kinase gamma-like [Prunus avium]